jgi:(E)-4-hydroxy-3-methylbut-2-enyl-diphosphate synthase
MIPNHLNIDDKVYTSSVILVGSVPLGGSHPVRIQSMTNTDTLDTKASVAQCIRIIEAGADFVRLTAQGVREAENLASVKKELAKAGFNTPLIADIHFNPSAAEVAAGIVEKVRINPGNYADKRASFIKHELTAQEYTEELERIHSRLLPLINICHHNNTVIRIGVNHGSLSDRIMTRYGNTPEGMSVSAMEFIRIMQAENFYNIVLSMKSSETGMMIEANRLLVHMMKENGISYPIHLGVTEAGEGEDGRVSSASGIGALLSEGIGDTIRVSLSEDPEKEIPVCRKLTEYFPRGINSLKPPYPVAFKSPVSKPPAFSKIKGPLVVADFTVDHTIKKETYIDAGYRTDPVSGEIMPADCAADIIILPHCPEDIPAAVPVAVPFSGWLNSRVERDCHPVITPEDIHAGNMYPGVSKIIEMSPDSEIAGLGVVNEKDAIVILRYYPDKDRYAADRFLNLLHENNLAFNVILNPVFDEDDIENLRIVAPALLGRYITDGNVSGICISNKGNTDRRDHVSLSFSIFQCTSVRITRTVYLSCPTCGRTRFNLQETLKEVKRVTGHLKGLKIAVMGCIVNGPGEMAGADYGYVGAGAGKVHIYKGTVPVLKNIPEKDAPEKLLRFIESDQASL